MAKKSITKGSQPNFVTEKLAKKEAARPKGDAKVGVTKMSPALGDVYLDKEKLAKPMKAVKPSGSAASAEAFTKSRSGVSTVRSIGKAVKQDANVIAERRIAGSSNPEATARTMAAQTDIDKEATSGAWGKAPSRAKRTDKTPRPLSTKAERRDFPSLGDAKIGEVEIPKGVANPTSASKTGARSIGDITISGETRGLGGRNARAGKKVTRTAQLTDPVERVRRNRIIATAHADTQKFTEHMASDHGRSLSHANALKEKIHGSLAGMEVSDLHGLQVPCIGSDCRRTVPATSESLKCEGSCSTHPASASARGNLGRSSEKDLARNGAGTTPVPAPSGRSAGTGIPWMHLPASKREIREAGE